MSAMESQIRMLLSKMTLAEKLGQMRQIHGDDPGNLDLIRQGRVGSFLNVTGEAARRFQEVALRESRLGIPLLFGRDVIHGLRTVMPIPLGQAASFNPDLVEEAATVAAGEAARAGIHWTFAPMVDVSRDSRWGRIAESAGEDPLLNALMGAAMVRGFQQRQGESIRGIAACAKHYVGYGATEGGRDYNTTLIPEGELRDVYLPPFKACVEAGVATVMSAFNDLNGVPTSGNRFTLRMILKHEWQFDGMVVSDWGSITEMIAHGYCADAKAAALAGIRAGVDMEMVSDSYVNSAETLLSEGHVTPAMIDEAVTRILRLKFRLGLFEKAPAGATDRAPVLPAENLKVARQLARESLVLLKNNGILPLARTGAVAILGPLADSPVDMLGTWALDGRAEDVRTPLAALREVCGARLRYQPGLPSARSLETGGIAAAVSAARESDLSVLFLGEDAIMSGEAHCRAVLDLPGAQAELLKAVKAAGRPLVVVLFAGRALCLGPVIDLADAVIYAWHPGVMAGPAITDVLLGGESPSGRLPVSMPWVVGQIPVYYNRRNTGRPAPEGKRAGLPVGTPLDPGEFCPSYIDADPTPQFPFGFGLTYSRFEYSPVRLSAETLPAAGTLCASVTLKNAGSTPATEVVQLYIRDLVGSRTRPIRELKGFQRVALPPGESRDVVFTLTPAMLAFHDEEMRLAPEAGRFQVWISPDSASGRPAEFELLG